MNVGFYFSDSPPDSGGAYTIEHEIFSSLLGIAGESRHNFIIYSNKEIRRQVNDYPIKKIKIQNLKNPSSFERIFSYIIKNLEPLFPLYKKRINLKYTSLESQIKEKIDLLIFSTPFHYPVDIPYITMVWDLQHRLQPWFPEVSSNGEWYHRENLFSKTLKRASFIICGTEVGREEISFFYGIQRDKIIILPHPSPTFFLNSSKTNAAAILKKYGVEKNYLFYPAQFWPHKNHINLLYALKIVREVHKIPLSLVLVGSDKGNLDYIKKMILDLNLSEAVIILGFIPQKDLITFYQKAFALVYTTLFGPENLPPLEAFALKCPVIASNVPGSQEQLGDAALFVDPRNSKEIAQVIVSLYDNPNLRSQLIEKGYVRAQKWTGKDFMRGLFSLMDDFENIRRCWE